MTRDDIHLLYEYDRWANNKVLQAASALSNEQFMRDLGGSFSSVRDTIVHILAGEWNWLVYWQHTPHDAAFMTELKTRRETLFNPAAFPDCAAVQLKWLELEKDQIKFLNVLTDEKLESLLPARGTHIKLVHLMQHLTNHSTYHRGQVSLMMRQLAAAPAATDFHMFLAESPRTPRPRTKVENNIRELFPPQWRRQSESLHPS